MNSFGLTYGPRALRQPGDSARHEVAVDRHRQVTAACASVQLPRTPPLGRRVSR